MGDEFIENENKLHANNDDAIDARFIQENEYQTDDQEEIGQGGKEEEELDDPFDLDNEDDDIDLESVRALSLKEGLDYENDITQAVFIPDIN
jgi:hypothetical protein